MVNVLALVLALFAADRFAYDRNAAAEVRVVRSTSSGGALVEDIVYTGNVPATLVRPKNITGRAPAILFMHWGLGDRHTFVDEALLVAKDGVVSLLIDAPFVRPATATASEAQQLVQTVIDLRRGIDMLEKRTDVDAKRIGLVGLSYGAHAGAILSGVEPRIRAFVLMGGLASNSDIPATEHLDAEEWVARPRTSPVFLQFANRDEYISREQADRYAKAAGRLSITKWYEGGHEFVRSSRDDRLQWLSGHLSFSRNDPTYHAVSAEPAPGFAGTPYADLSKLGVVLEIPGMQQIPVRENIVFKRVGDRALMMDIYYPFGMEQEPELRIPAIILVSGQGAPALMPRLRQIRFVTTAARAIAARANRAVVVYDIRSVGDKDRLLPDVAADLDDAIAYVRDHGKELQIDSESIGILARSAGGPYGIHAAWFGEKPYIKAVALQYVDVDGRSLKEAELPASFLADVNAIELAKRPGKKAPLLLVTNQYDFFYDAGAVETLKKKAKANDVTLEHIHLPNSDHGFDLVNDTEESRDAFLKTILFFREKMPIRR